MSPATISTLAAAALLACPAAIGQEAKEQPVRIQQGATSRPQPSQEDLIAKRSEKLKKPFLKNANWVVDYDKARAEAKKTDKVIFTYFTRSFAT